MRVVFLALRLLSGRSFSSEKIDVRCKGSAAVPEYRRFVHIFLCFVIWRLPVLSLAVDRPTRYLLWKMYFQVAELNAFPSSFYILVFDVGPLTVFGIAINSLGLSRLGSLLRQIAPTLFRLAPPLSRLRPPFPSECLKSPLHETFRLIVVTRLTAANISDTCFFFYINDCNYTFRFDKKNLFNNTSSNIIMHFLLLFGHLSYYSSYYSIFTGLKVSGWFSIWNQWCYNAIEITMVVNAQEHVLCDEPLSESFSRRTTNLDISNRVANLTNEKYLSLET